MGLSKAACDCDLSVQTLVPATGMVEIETCILAGKSRHVSSTENPRRVRGGVQVHEMSNGYQEMQRVIDRDAPSDACFSFEISAFRGNSLRKAAISASWVQDRCTTSRI